MNQKIKGDKPEEVKDSLDEEKGRPEEVGEKPEDTEK